MKKNDSGMKLNRRKFLAAAGMAAVAPNIITGCATTTEGAKRPAPSERITMGVVGWGMQGPGNTRSFLGLPDCQVVAACDLHKGRLNHAVSVVNEHYKNKDCKAYHDFREMMARTDIDAVMIAVPDHWHALLAVTAANSGKDIYGEKPLARTIGEQQAIVQAVQKNKRIWQMGSWQRSTGNFHKGAEMVANGLIGKVTRVEVGLPQGHHDFAGTLPALQKKLEGQEVKDPAKIVPGMKEWDLAVSDPPTELDYDMWLGPSKTEPYIDQRVYMNWRWNYNTGGGQLLDWVGHHVDIAHWGLGFDRSGPSEIEGHGEFPDPKAIWNTCTKYRIEAKYPHDIQMTIAGGHSDIRDGTKWIGDKGWIWVNRGTPGFEGSDPSWMDFKQLPEEMRKVKLYKSENHWANFIECVKSRKPTIAPVETGHHSAIPGHLGLISMLTGRKLKWDVKHEEIIGDPEATKLMTRPYRLPWQWAQIA
jgi:predicted dehydrogenase